MTQKSDFTMFSTLYGVKLRVLTFNTVKYSLHLSNKTTLD